MQSGDVLVAYTDGLTEARKPGSEDEFFGEDGLKRIRDESAAAGLSARDICAKLAEAALEVSGGAREDDVTVLVARRA
jgi:serine phosphatase RsbU (regulator of sigma subunit)